MSFGFLVRNETERDVMKNPVARMVDDARVRVGQSPGTVGQPC